VSRTGQFQYLDSTKCRNFWSGCELIPTKHANEPESATHQKLICKFILSLHSDNILIYIQPWWYRRFQCTTSSSRCGCWHLSHTSSRACTHTCKSHPIWGILFHKCYITANTSKNGYCI